MSIAILTDSNSGITQKEAGELGIVADLRDGAFPGFADLLLLAVVQTALGAGHAPEHVVAAHDEPEYVPVHLAHGLAQRAAGSVLIGIAHQYCFLIYCWVGESRARVEGGVSRRKLPVFSVS